MFELDTTLSAGQQNVIQMSFLWWVGMGPSSYASQFILN